MVRGPLPPGVIGAARASNSIAGRGERRAVLAVLALLLAVNLLTAELYPVVWVDEAMYVDPAASYHLGQGLRSAAWSEHPRTEVFVSDRPLYLALLIPWMGVFGFGLLAVRSLGHVLSTAILAGIWLAAVRLRVLATASSRLLLVVLVGCGSGFAFACRSGRPDAASMVPAVLALLSVSLRSSRTRRIACLASGALIPFAGLHVVAYLVLAGLFVLLFVGRSLGGRLALLGVGIVAGFAALGGFLWHAGLLGRYLEAGLFSVHTSLSAVGATGVVPLLRAELNHLVDFADAVYVDRSSAALLGGALVVLILLAARRNLELRGPLGFAVVVGVWVPTALAALAKYPLYYAWMGYIPLGFAVLKAREQLADPWLRRLLGAAAAAAIAVGLPAQLAIAVTDRDVRSYALVEDLVERTVPPGATAYVDFACFYPVKARAREVFFPTYDQRLTDDERERIDAVILRTGETIGWERIDPLLARRWTPTDEGVAVRRRGIEVLRAHWRYVDYESLHVFRPVSSQRAAGVGATPNNPDDS